ncbi:MAG TPA: ABC transporter permease [Candidatus Acidoferrales bacterium]
MDYLRLMLKNAARNRRRTLLTVLSMAVSLFLLVSLRTLLAELEFSSVLTDESALRLITRHAVSLQIPLPLSFGQRIQQVPGVEVVSPYQPVVGYYQDPKNLVPHAGIDPESAIRLASEFKFNPTEVGPFQKERTGALVGRKLMGRFGWKVGDRITTNLSGMFGMFFPFNLELLICGTYTGPDEGALLFHYEYFNELARQHMPGRADQVAMFWIKGRSAEDVPRVAAAIDELFRNSEAPTRTETEKAFGLSFTSMLGNVKLFLALIAAAAVFAILLVSMNTMGMSVRERRGEIAVLKTLGFRRGQVLGLLVGESVLIALGGGLVGVVGAKLVFGSLDMYKLTGGIIQHFQIRLLTVGLGLGVAGLVGVVSAVVPAWRAVNGSIAAALRQVG